MCGFYRHRHQDLWAKRGVGPRWPRGSGCVTVSTVDSYKLYLCVCLSVCVCVCLSVCLSRFSRFSRFYQFMAYISLIIGRILIKLGENVGTLVRMILLKSNCVTLFGLCAMGHVGKKTIFFCISMRFRACICPYPVNIFSSSVHCLFSSKPVFNFFKFNLLP